MMNSIISNEYYELDKAAEENEITKHPCCRCGAPLKRWELIELPSCADCLTEKEAEDWFNSPSGDILEMCAGDVRSMPINESKLHY